MSWMVRPPCEITDQLAVGTQNCFSTLFYTPYTKWKQAPRMHQNAPLLDKKSENYPGPSPTGEGDAPSPDPTLLGAFDSRAFGARRSRSFSFTTRTLHVGDTDKTRLYVTRSYYVLLIIVCTVMFVVRLYKRDSCVIVIIVNLKKVKVNVNLFI